MCDVCEGKTKYTSVHHELKIGDGFLKNRRYLLVTFKGSPFTKDFIGEFEINYCPDCGKKLKEE